MCLVFHKPFAVNLSIKLFWTLINFGNKCGKIFAWSWVEGKNCQRGSGEVKNKADPGAGEEVESQPPV